MERRNHLKRKSESQMNWRWWQLDHVSWGKHDVDVGVDVGVDVDDDVDDDVDVGVGVDDERSC
jgi:hypothetical protein